MVRRFAITRDFLRGLTATGAYQEFNSDRLQGFAVKVTPAGSVTFTVRFIKPDGKHGRRTIGRWPEMDPGRAFDLAKKQLANVDKAGETHAERLDRRRRLATEEKELGTATTFEAFVEGRYAEHARANYKSADHTIDRLLKAFEGFRLKPLSDITAWQVEKWRSERLRAGKKSATVEREINALRGVFSRAVKWHVIPESPMPTVGRLTITGNTRTRYLTASEETALRQALDRREGRIREGRARGNAWRAARKRELMPDLAGQSFVDHLKPAVLLTMNTGLRRGEMLALRWTDIDLERAVLTAHDTATKSGKTRHIPLNAEALSVVTSWRAQSTGDLVFPSKPAPRLEDPDEPAQERPLSELKTAWQTLLRDAGIANFRWHDLRHHFASKLVMAGVDLNTVRELLGHADLQMTLRYAHLAPEHKALAVARLTPVVNLDERREKAS